VRGRLVMAASCRVGGFPRAGGDDVSTIASRENASHRENRKSSTCHFQRGG
jgi:hypothetical protein